MIAGQPVRAVLFDLDGTLIDTIDDITAAGNAMLARAGRAPITRGFAATLVGTGAAGFVARALAGDLHAAADTDEARRCLPIFLDEYARINGKAARLYAGVAEGLEAFTAMGLRLAVVTNKPRGLTVALLERCGLLARFDAIVAGGDTERRKPDAQPLLRACELMAVDVASVVMIGDSLNDVAAARAAGCPVLVVPYGYNEGRPVQTLASDGIVASLIEAAMVISGGHYSESTHV